MFRLAEVSLLACGYWRGQELLGIQLGPLLQARTPGTQVPPNLRAKRAGVSVFVPVSSPQAHSCVQVLTRSWPKALAREGSWFPRLLGEHPCAPPRPTSEEFAGLYLPLQKSHSFFHQPPLPPLNLGGKQAGLPTGPTKGNHVPFNSARLCRVSLLELRFLCLANGSNKTGLPGL